MPAPKSGAKILASLRESGMWGQHRRGECRRAQGRAWVQMEPRGRSGLDRHSWPSQSNPFVAGSLRPLLDNPGGNFAILVSPVSKRSFELASAPVQGPQRCRRALCICTPPGNSIPTWIFRRMNEELTDAEQAAAERHFRENTDFLYKGCPACRSTDFTVNKTLTITPAISRNGRPLDSKGAPLIQAACENCGYIASFSAVMVDGIELVT